MDALFYLQNNTVANHLNHSKSQNHVNYGLLSCTLKLTRRWPARNQWLIRFGSLAAPKLKHLLPLIYFPSRRQSYHPPTALKMDYHVPPCHPTYSSSWPFSRWLRWPGTIGVVRNRTWRRQLCPKRLLSSRNCSSWLQAIQASYAFEMTGRGVLRPHRLQLPNQGSSFNLL